MKLSDYINLKEFLTLLFAFFKENRIVSSIKPVDDYNLLLDRILESEFNYISYYPGMYSVDFKLSDRIGTGEVYYFIFGSRENGGSMLIDLGERELSSFMNFSWNNEKHPPFLMNFEKDGKIMINSEVTGFDAEYLAINDVCNLKEFTSYLVRNREQGRLNVVVVE